MTALLNGPAPIHRPQCSEAEHGGLDAQLLALARCGRPFLHLTSGGWRASIDMNTNTTGTSFEVKSDMDHKSPSAAVAQLMERVETALRTLGAR
jgi:hypothetical protein